MRLFRSDFFPAKRKEEENKQNDIAETAPIPTATPFETGADALKKDMAMDSAQTATETRPESKRDRVRRILVNPLVDAGMRRQPRMKADAHQAFLTRLTDKLSYLSDLHLRGLAERIAKSAKGPDRNQWPDEVTIVNWAHFLALPPPKKCPFTVSVLRSRAGVRARQLGYHAELLIALREGGPPFSKYDTRWMPDAARENREEVRRVSEAIRLGTATVERRQWLDWYQRHEAEAVAIMDATEQEIGAVK